MNIRGLVDNRRKKKELKMVNKIKNKNKNKYLNKSDMKRKINNSQIFTNIKNINEDGVIELKSNQLAYLYKVQALDLSLTNDNEQHLFFNTLSKLFRLNIPMKLYKFDEKINLNLNKENIDRLIEKNEYRPERKAILESNKYFIETIEEENLTSASSYYFAIIAKNKEELAKSKDSFENACYNVVPKISISLQKNKKILLKIFANMYFSDVNVDQLMYYDFIDLIVPTSLSERPGMLKVEDKDIQLVTIKNYPLFIEHGFLNRIVNMANVKAAITIKDTIDQAKLVSVLNSSFKAVLADYNSSKNLSDVNEMKSLMENYQLLIDQINNNDEKIKEVTVVLAVSGDKKRRDETIKEIKRHADLYHIKIDVPKLRQMELWQAYDLTSNGVPDYALMLPTTTLACAYPCTSIYHNDPEGFLLGEDSVYGLPVFFDPFVLMPSRPSHNILIFGTTGSGKSFIEKLLETSEITRSKVFIFDVENENQKEVERCGGEYIDLSSKSLINPLQVRYIEDDDNEEVSILAKHLGILENFFSSVFIDITEKEMVILLDLVEKFYTTRDITKTTTLEEFEKLGNKDYPIFSDLYAFVLEKQKDIKNTTEKELYTNIEILLKRLITGQDGNLFNGITTIDLSNDLVCFNLQELLYNSSRRLINTQLLNLLTFLNHKIMDNKRKNDKRGIKESGVLYIDEFHIFEDEDNPILLKYLAQFARRCRKYFFSIVIASQSPKDTISSDSLLRHAVAIFNNCQYKMFGMLKEDDLQALDVLFSNNKLTESQKHFLAHAVQGQFLLFIDSYKKIMINVFANEVQKWYMGESDAFPGETNG